MSVYGKGRLQFGDYELDCEAGKLLRGGWPVKLQPQPLRVLALLLERPGEIFSREEIQNRVWGETTFVEFDQGLNYCIRQIRLALRDTVSKPAYIETLPKQGYRFIAKVAAVPGGAEEISAPESQSIAEIETPAPPPVRTEDLPAAFWRGPPSPGHRRRRTVCPITAPASATASVHAAHRLHRFRNCPCHFAGRTHARLHSGDSDWAADQIYVKMLPNGEPASDGRYSGETRSRFFIRRVADCLHRIRRS